jgi:hypothetical protein
MALGPNGDLFVVHQTNENTWDFKQKLKWAPTLKYLSCSQHQVEYDKL